MALSEFSTLPTLKLDPEKGPNLLAGAASPLWLMFGGAAVAGASWWWWASRWREAVNVEALMALAPEPVSTGAIDEAIPELQAEPAALAVVEALVEPVAPAAEALVEAASETVVATDEAAEAVVDELQAVVEPVMETAAEATIEIVESTADLVEAAADDLTLLVGIGPKLSASLAELGVTRFEQIAAWTDEELGTFDALLNLKGRAERNSWVAQAKRLVAGA